MFSTRTIVIVALFLALAVGYYLLAGRGTDTGDPQKQLLPLKPADVTRVQVVKGDLAATFVRGADSKWEAPGAPTPTPTPTPDPQATPSIPVVQFGPSTRVESTVRRLTELRVDRVVARADQTGGAAALTSAEYGLDAPRMEFHFGTKAGERILAVGGTDPRETSYYVRRSAQQDVVLVSRYELDDIMRNAEDAAEAVQPA